MSSTAHTLDILPAGDRHRVAVVKGGQGSFRREPCPGCPWRKDQDGVFPPEAFVHSANTAQEGSTHTFGCHESGIEKPATCAGFLLRGADRNLAVAIREADGVIDRAEVSDGGHELHQDYRAMAEANGVDPRDPALDDTRPPLNLADRTG